MTKINIYCLFDKNDNFCGVYSSLKTAHRDAMALCNQGNSNVWLRLGGRIEPPAFSVVRNLFKGQTNVKVTYISDIGSVQVLKTKLIE